MTFVPPLPISQATSIAFENDLLIPVAKPGDTTPYYLEAGAIPAVGLKVATVALTNQQLLNLHSNPVIVVPAPGDGFVTQIVVSCYTLIFGTVAFQKGASDTSGLWYGAIPPNTSVTADPGDGGVWLAAANAIKGQAAGSGGPIITQPTADYVNQPVVLWIPDANMTAGNGSGSVTVFYVTVPVPF